MDSKINEKFRQERSKSDSSLPEGSGLREAPEQPEFSCVVDRELQETPNTQEETNMDAVKR